MVERIARRSSRKCSGNSASPASRVSTAPLSMSTNPSPCCGDGASPHRFGNGTTAVIGHHELPANPHCAANDPPLYRYHETELRLSSRSHRMIGGASSFVAAVSAMNEPADG